MKTMHDILCCFCGTPRGEWHKEFQVIPKITVKGRLKTGMLNYRRNHETGKFEYATDKEVFEFKLTGK